MGRMWSDAIKWDLFSPNQRLFTRKRPNLPLQGVQPIKWDCKRSQFCNRNCANTNHITKQRARRQNSLKLAVFTLEIFGEFLVLLVKLKLKAVYPNRMKVKKNFKSEFPIFLLSFLFPFISFREAGFICAALTQPWLSQSEPCCLKIKLGCLLRYQFELVDIKTRNRTSHLSGLVKIQVYI